MSHRVRLSDVQLAWEARDPALYDLIEMLVTQEDPVPDEPSREGAPTFDRFLREMQTLAFRRKSREEQAHYRQEQLKALEAEDAEVPLPDRLRVYEVLLALWEENSMFARVCLLEAIARLPLRYGPWRALKRIFKEAEVRGDTEIYGALAARLDVAFADGDHEMSARTVGYLCRRAWRYLRRTAETLPACYADIAVDVLARYDDGTQWSGTWIANHIFYHETGDYSAKSFHFRSRPSTLLKYRAFADLWQRTPRPLFSLLERAQSEQVRRFATSALKTDFRAKLREVEPTWVARLVNVGSRIIDEFVVWILNNVPRFEQAAFGELGLHDAVLRLFDSDSSEARVYAADYARTHARDLPVSELIRLSNNSHEAVRKLVADLLQSRDPRKEVGLEAWGELLETEHGHDLAAATLRKHFGARELTPEWFASRILSPHAKAAQFAQRRLGGVHPYKKLGSQYFCDLVDELEFDSAAPRDRQRLERQVARFCFDDVLARGFDVNKLDVEFLRRALICPATTHQVCEWIGEGRLKTDVLPVEFFKTLAFHPQFDQDPWIAELKAGERTWAKELQFSEDLSERVLEWLGDVRSFSPEELGFDWLMQLVKRTEPRYHDFAVQTMTKAFLPADFAAGKTEPAAEEKAAGEEEIQVDLGGQSFMFTGKLATMTRAEAQGKVRAASGSVASTVSAKLAYLVIGDEGSPLYGEGRKGSKQVKAEKLRDDGHDVKIISETAFLQMLAGEQREFSEDAVQDGCERLWEMALAEGKENEPLAKFSLAYMRMHHPDICLAETDRPVDPGAEMPPDFLSFERLKPLFFDRRQPLRAFALEMAKWEMSRWKPPIHGLVELCESPHSEVRQFVATAMLAEDLPEHRRYRIDPKVLTPDAVYSFCESNDEGTRALGMELILRNPRLRMPEELFRLTESPDRKVRAFVVRSLWSLYRDRGITQDWKPWVPPEAEAAKGKKKQAKPRDYGEGAPPRPETLPAEHSDLRTFLRRILFEIPPAKLEKPKGDETGVEMKLKPLPARKAKLTLVETLRDLAIEDREFAEEVTPLMTEFMGSRGKSEMEACLVAVTRIRKAYPELAVAAEESA